MHQVARAAERSCRVAYVDNEAIAVAHSRHLLRGDPLATVTQHDLRDVDAVLSAPTVAGLLDLGRPVALLALTVLQYLSDETGPAAVMAGYAARLAPGSAVVVSHLTGEHTGPDMDRLVELTRETGTPVHLRGRAEVAALLGPAVAVPPGVVMADEWRPDDPYRPDTSDIGGIYAAVGRIPAAASPQP